MLSLARLTLTRAEQRLKKFEKEARATGAAIGKAFLASGAVVAAEEELGIDGVILTMYDARTRLSAGVASGRLHLFLAGSESPPVVREATQRAAAAVPDNTTGAKELACAAGICEI